MITRVLLGLWQLPQNILGSLVILFNWKNVIIDSEHKSCIVKHSGNMGIPFWGYTIIEQGTPFMKTDHLHEIGHLKQSKIFGWFYIFIFVISIFWKMYVSITCRNEVIFIKLKKQFDAPWERQADRFGNVYRSYGITTKTLRN